MRYIYPASQIFASPEKYCSKTRDKRSKFNPQRKPTEKKTNRVFLLNTGNGDISGPDFLMIWPLKDLLIDFFGIGLNSSRHLHQQLFTDHLTEGFLLVIIINNLQAAIIRFLSDNR